MSIMVEGVMRVVFVKKGVDKSLGDVLLSWG